MTAGLKENGYFLLPGGTPVSAQLQFARTVARRAERRLWTLNRQDAVPEDILSFINRLSDLFFVMARFDMQQQDWRRNAGRLSHIRQRRNKGLVSLKTFLGR